jgi:hypothetical protein
VSSASGAGYHPPMTLFGVDQRTAGTAMLEFGVIGIVLAGLIALALVGTAVAARDLDERLMTEQAQLASTLEDLATTTAAVVTSMENASTTLETSSASILHARDVLDALASATTSLADGLEISILGSQPFAGAAARFRTFSEQVAIFREDADRGDRYLDRSRGASRRAARNLAGDRRRRVRLGWMATSDTLRDDPAHPLASVRTMWAGSGVDGQGRLARTASR